MAENEKKIRELWGRIGMLRSALHAYERGRKKGKFAGKEYAETADKASAEIAVLRLKLAQMGGGNG